MTPPSTPLSVGKTLPRAAKGAETSPPGGVRDLSWADVAGTARELAVKVHGATLRSGGPEPDYVLAVANGGLVPAAILRGALHVEDVGAVQLTHYSGEGVRRKGGARMYGLLPSAIRNGHQKHVLVVDDVAETGDTLRVLEGELDGLVPRVTWAALHLKRATPAGLPRPFFFAEAADPETWLRFPWEAPL